MEQFGLTEVLSSLAEYVSINGEETKGHQGKQLLKIGAALLDLTGQAGRMESDRGTPL